VGPASVGPLDGLVTMSAMNVLDFVVIGAGPAGEAAAHKARSLGASVAIVDREWFGGSCPHVGCVPSKSLLHAADRRASGEDYSWARASARRDYMINRPIDAAVPDDTSHVRALEAAGAVVLRGEGRITGRGVVTVTNAGRTRDLRARNVVVAVGSTSKVPPIEGLAATRPWTNREATLAREQPRSLLVLGGGPTGCELAQVYARFGVPVTIVQSGPRLAPTEHPRSSEALRFALEADGVHVRTGVRALRARAGAGRERAHVVELDDGSTAEGHVILLAVGREFPLGGLGLEHYDVAVSGPGAYRRDGSLRLADGLWVAGDPAGPELHTHQGHYQGELVVRMALGEAVTPDYRALPRATYTSPEAASVGLTLDQALAIGIDAFECVAAYPTSARGYAVEAATGHVTIVVDRGTRELTGAAMACPDASAAIHECVLAIKARITVDVLAETIHAFPSTSRIFNGLFAEALVVLGAPRA
jgi:pyruvate/2-oxoglutarate dehydrogenase complex dihydrolipoamide dehydrogenase (E3) component